ncbi:hypothetical protein CPB84DRAFT_1782873 [Gymnopilus junonius]|uniref:Rhodopsin domain-containing protein n=1 Tax=Gymnopilus junonius TaxID=109634 RepID=A0A9P5TMF8_GYMJU|nr:hypothetical protein CPB84DRAFT_1782873 [Gymnopilus junonius]
MRSPPQDYLAWRVPLSILNLLAIAFAIYRLIHRYLIKRLWWDDYIAIIPLLLTLVYWPLFLARYPYRLPTSIAYASMRNRVLNSFWLSFLPFILIVRFARIVLALSLARLFPVGHRARRWSFIQCVACITISVASCKQTSPLLSTSANTHNCIYATKNIPLRSLVLLVGERPNLRLLLVISPLLFFWGLKLPLNQKRLILILFCASALTTLSVIAYASVTLNSQASMGIDWLFIIQGLRHLEAGVSLLVCNLAVVSTCIYQKIVRFSNRERPQLEIVGETRHASQRECTCALSNFSSEFLSPMTLTEISTSSYLTSSSLVV